MERFEKTPSRASEILDETRIGDSREWREAETASTTSIEAVRGDFGWETMSGRRMSRRISWWGKVIQMKRDRWVRRIYDFVRAQLDRDPNTQNWCNLTLDVCGGTW